MITLEFVDQEDLDRAMALKTRRAVKDALERQERDHASMLAAIIKAAGGKVVVPVSVLQSLGTERVWRFDHPNGSVELSVR